MVLYSIMLDALHDIVGIANGRYVTDRVVDLRASVSLSLFSAGRAREREERERVRERGTHLF
jgi:hypothetical protein